MATMESPIAPVEAGGEVDEVVYPCKGCGEVLEEGKAFELAGNRWHLDCFRCHHCGTILDSESNLLLLGDGSLICNNCTYSCHSCGNKIEDLAILTGDLAFCASCFKCRNCKRKIDNLKYARTSQGIFCMQCHESLMARRRKKARTQRPRDPSATSNGSGSRTEKQLPAIPPPNGEPLVNGQKALSASNTNTPTVRSPVSGISPGIDPLNSANSPILDDRSEPVSRTKSVADKRTSVLSSKEDGDGDFDIPIALDTGPPSSHRSPPIIQTSIPGQRDLTSPPPDSGKSSVYTDPLPSAGGPRSASRDRTQRPKASPHIAYQEKGRRPSADAGDVLRKIAETAAPMSSSQAASPTGGTPSRPMGTIQSNDFDKSDFRLEEAPRVKRSSGSQSGSKGGSPSLALASQTDGSALLEQSVTAANSARANRKHDDARQDVRSPVSSTTAEKKSTAEILSPSSEGPPPRSSSRPALQTSSTKSNGDFTAPREAPQPPRHKPSESTGSIQSERFQTRHPTTPVSGFDNDDLGVVEGDEQPGLFRKMSKAVKHGRSYSDKLGASSPKQQISRSESVDISSPIQTPADPKEEIVSLRNQLKFQKQRVAELETEKNALQEEVNGTVNIRKATADLKEKRNTIAFLDSQKEMFVRELEVMAEHASKLKEWPRSKQFNAENIKSELMEDLSRKMATLRQSLAADIEQLVQQKNDLTNEISNLIQMKDKGFQEYESLSTKNAQLNDLNGQLVRNIQELYKQGRDPSAANGLGIFTNDKSGPTSLDGRSLVSSEPSQLSGDTEVEPAVLTAPHLVNIRKTGQPKKFNWKKSAKTVGKGLGFKAAFTNSTLKEEQSAEGMAYSDMPMGESPVVVTTLPRQGADPAKGSWGQFLTGAKAERGGLKPGPIQREPSQSSMASVNASETMFGSDLTARCDFEKQMIPTIVTRCIDEVESRGMNMEGIYRKSGSSTQVKQLQAGMERDMSSFDISDPDLDIHSVTGMLKQYFRKLPTPLITYSVYESFLEVGTNKDWSSVQRVETLRWVVKNLPPCHRDTLQVLTGHLVRVVEHHGENLMTPLNLAVVFAPTITRPESLEREMADVQAQRMAVQYLLELHREVFAVELSS